MRFLSALLLITITLHTTSGRCRRPRPNPVLGALQNILSPANAERTMKMVKMATKRTLENTIPPSGIPSSPAPVHYSPPILPLPETNNFPAANQIPNFITPNQLSLTNSVCQSPSQPVPLSIPWQMPGPVPVQTPNPMPVQITNPPQVQIPYTMPIQLSNPVPIQTSAPTPVPQVAAPNSIPIVPITQALNQPEIVLENNILPCPCQREIIYPSPEPTPSCIYNPVPEVSQPVPLTPAQDTFVCPIPSPATLFNPFLPVASPVSTWTQENLPTATSGTRSHYLRKIPIPPPTL